MSALTDSVTNPSQIDSNHVLFLHPSDTPSSLLVSNQLVGISNYNLWSRSLQIALLAKNKLGFVDDSCSKASFHSALHPQWERCNALVLSWILNTVSADLSAGVVFASSAASVWKDLKEHFEKIDGARVFFLHREIVTHHQGESSISEYYTKLKLLWDEYGALIPFSSCDCEESQQNLLHLTQQKLFQFLMGLNESYSAIPSQLLIMQPLPTVNKAYSMLVQEEAQRVHLSGISSIPDSSAFYSHASAGSSDRMRFLGIFDYCKLKGHKWENCYRLIGFPSDFKFTKKRNPNPSDVALSVNVSSPDLSSLVPSSVSSSVQTSVPSFTSDQYNQILSLLNTAPSADSAVNLAGIVTSCLPAVNNVHIDSWIMDTGATYHVLSNFSSLIAPTSCLSLSRCVQFPNGKSVPITHVGSCVLSSNILLSNVLFVPQFSQNLLSISKLTRDLHCFVTFYPDFCLIQDLSTGRMKGIGKQSRGLYFFESLASGSDHFVSTSVVPYSVNSVPVHFDNTNCMVASINNTFLWHARLGHASLSKLVKLPFPDKNTLDLTTLHKCSVCPLAKQTRLPFPDHVHSATSPFSLIHIDLWGPYRISTHSGHRFFLPMLMISVV
ncbi:hypothetical protein HRI_002168800 [Hibiscus trionum]|uniref:GAG-pre-integrase domain-containing protein n=1 Tax=Hibiscus trionum TaxID=183268 RepID=A0A9W7M3Y9_HIBTR|nr:hypothetical protein HRI_002168800 [Hibiscus trionum]